MKIFDDERDLLRRLRDGDEEAFAVIFHRYKDPLTHRLLYLLKSETLTQDVLQDLFLKVWGQRSYIDIDKSFRSFLYRVAENMVFDLFRKAKKEREIFQEILQGGSEFYTHVEERVFKEEEIHLLQSLLDKLPRRRKEIFIACKLEGKSYKEAAAEFGVSVSTINDHIQKATHYLKSQPDTIQFIQFSLLFLHLLKK